MSETYHLSLKYNTQAGSDFLTHWLPTFKCQGYNTYTRKFEAIFVSRKIGLSKYPCFKDVVKTQLTQSDRVNSNSYRFRGLERVNNELLGKWKYTKNVD
jgi:hypothetical protein